MSGDSRGKIGAGLGVPSMNVGGWCRFLYVFWLCFCVGGVSCGERGRTFSYCRFGAIELTSHGQPGRSRVRSRGGALRMLRTRT
jgi:hypothetical protein